MALIATAGASNANSFATLVQAQAYHDARLHNDDWTDAGSTDQEKALQWATRILDNVNWYGVKADANQALRWPRYDVSDREGSFFDSDSIPQFLINATAELAFKLIQSDRGADSGTEGLKKLKVGPIELEIDLETKIAEIAPAVITMIKPYSFAGSTVKMSR